ncbi:MAG: DUF302 domain-containing protein [Chromatiales bacterium]|jgi:uncharacterized protein (DUF302 family)
MYSFSVQLNDTFQNVLDRVAEALQHEGFGVLTDIDFAATVKNKLGIERKPYRILGACNPPLANQAVEAEAEAGLLLPCNVVVSELENGAIEVAFLDPMVIMRLSENKTVAAVASQANARLQRVRAALQQV